MIGRSFGSRVGLVYRGKDIHGVWCSCLFIGQFSLSL